MDFTEQLRSLDRESEAVDAWEGNVTITLPYQAARQLQKMIEIVRLGFDDHALAVALTKALHPEHCPVACAAVSKAVAAGYEEMRSTWPRDLATWRERAARPARA